MAPEIADSDGESEFEDLAAAADSGEQTRKDNSAYDYEVAQDQYRPIDVNFDDFISQSPAAQSHSPSDNATAKRSTGSTEELLRQRDEAQKALVGSSPSKSISASTYQKNSDTTESNGSKTMKRSHTELANKASLQKDESSKPRKRHKSYGSTRSDLSSSQNMLFGGSEELVQSCDRRDGPKKRGQVELAAEHVAEKVGTPGTTNPRKEDIYEEEDHIIQSRRRKTSGMHDLQNSVSRSTGGISTTESSMGGYQSINIDLRGFDSLDNHANPFGTASQISADDDAGTTTIKSIFSQASSHRDHRRTTEQGSVLGQQVVVREGLQATSTTHDSTTIDPSLLMNNIPYDFPHDTQRLSSSVDRLDRRQLKLTDRSSPTPEPPIGSPLTQSDGPTGANNGGNRPPTKKRGRKPKARPQETSPTTQDDEHDPHFSADEVHTSSTKEQGTSAPSHSIVNSATQHAQAPDGNGVHDITRKRKSFAATPRNESSPFKHPSSELNLSDEAIIGLPKENYVPRPSRTRSRKLVEEENTSNEPLRASQEDHQTAPDPPETMSPPKTQKRRGRKAKVKRAKTSAAALLKKSEQMLSDGEDDVLWVDTKPAKVKLDPLPELVLDKNGNVKQEESGLQVTQKSPANADAEADAELSVKQTEEQGHTSVTSKPGKKTGGILIEIPVHRDVTTAVPEPEPAPKKRGRKPKKAAEVTVNEDIANDETPEVISATNEVAIDCRAQGKSERDTGTILLDKNPNIQLTPADPALGPNTGENVAETASCHPPTPSPIKPAQKPSPHSPINPAGSWNSRNRYRVGLSRRTPIPSLLRNVREEKPVTAPKTSKKSAKKKADGGDNLTDAAEPATDVQHDTKTDANECDGDRDAEDGGKKDVNALLMMEEEYFSP